MKLITAHHREPQGCDGRRGESQDSTLAQKPIKGGAWDMRANATKSKCHSDCRGWHWSNRKATHCGVEYFVQSVVSLSSDIHLNFKHKWNKSISRPPLKVPRQPVCPDTLSQVIRHHVLTQQYNASNIVRPLVCSGTQARSPSSSLPLAQEQIGKTVFAQQESNNISH